MSTFAANIANRVPLYFHRLRDGETVDGIADRFNVTAKLDATDSVKLQTGNILVIDFRNGELKAS
jgi:hypothetical protein